MFLVGHIYAMDDISRAFGGERQTYLPQRNGRIVCGRFSVGMNPDAPEEVQVGDNPKVTEKAETLARQGGTIPVFMKVKNGSDTRNVWRYAGVYEFVELVDDPERIEAAEAKSGRENELSYLLRLRRVG